MTKAEEKILDLKFMAVHTKLDSIIEYNKKQNGFIETHEKRIGKLENWRWYLVGVVVGAIFVAGLVVRYVI